MQCPTKLRFLERKTDLFRDSLKRHVGIHGKEASSLYATRAAAESTRAAHACRECRTSKKRCDGLDPCSQCAKKGQSCTYGHRVPGSAQESGETGNYAAWLSDMSASPRPRDFEDSIPTPPKDNSQPANTSYNGMVDAAVYSCGIYNNSELNHPSRLLPQDPTFDLNFDPFLFWGSLETAGLSDNSLPNANIAVAAHTTDGEEPVPLSHLSHSGKEDQGEKPTRTCRTSAPIAQSAGENTDAARMHTVGQMRIEETSVVRVANLPFKDRDILVSEQYYHVRPISDGVYNNIYTFYIQHCDPSQLQPFPEAEILNTFMQMYFEFCHEELPLFHLPTLDPSPESWIVVAAIIAVGCNYSVSHYREEVSKTMLFLLHRAISQKVNFYL